jgi:hypothetical protein
MSVNETGEGASSVPVTGTVTGAGSVGVSGKGDAVGIQGEGLAWHGVEGISSRTTGGFGVFGVNRTGGSGVVGESLGWHAGGSYHRGG